MKFLKKATCFFAILVTLLSVVACGGVRADVSNDLTTSQSELTSKTVLDKSTSRNNNSINSTSLIPSSSHVHFYTKKNTSTEFLATEATKFSPATYYYSCECGLKSTETFEYGSVANYDREILDNYIDMLITKGSSSNAFWNTEEGGAATWNYIDGCMMTSFMKLYDITKDEKFNTFVTEYMDYVVRSDGSMRGYLIDDYNLDNINEGRVLFPLYASTKNEKYKTAIETLYSQLKKQPRTTLTNSFWHKQVYTQQIWLDGLYMAQPFYATYQKAYKDGNYTDIMNQFKVVETYMKKKTNGLYYHGFDTAKTQIWANKSTGLSPNFWLRAMGWYFAALSDLTEILPKDSTEWKTIQGYLKTAVDDVLPFMHKTKYMFYQIVDKGEMTDENGRKNYLETSGSALISYAILHAVNTGALDESYWNKGKSIFNGICTEYLSVDENQEMKLAGICKVAGLGRPNKRDGSVEYYLSEAIVENEAKGIAPLLMAYVEILKKD